MGAAAARWGNRSLSPGEIGEIIARVTVLGRRFSRLLVEHAHAEEDGSEPGRLPGVSKAAEQREDALQELERMMTAALDRLGAKAIRFRHNHGARSVEFDFRPASDPVAHQYPFFLGEGNVEQNVLEEGADE